jgi:DNA relaxase NicK
MKTTVDYCKFRTLSNPFAILEAIRPAFGTVADLVELSDQTTGKDGWEFRRLVKMAGDVRIAAIDYGGANQQGWVRFDMPGSGCEWVQDWQVVASLVDVLKQAQVKRADVALTTYDGSVNHDMVIAAHEARQFGTGGRHPHYKTLGGSDPRAGRTINVGTREKSAKFFRGYEKGFETLQKHVPFGIRDSVKTIEFAGHGHAAVEDVYRVEVEFKATDEKVVPWTIFTERDDYFAGAYPFCAALLPGAPEKRVQSMPDFGARMELLSQLENLRRSYGRILRTAAMAFGSEQAVFEIVMADAPSDRLIAAGVLTVVHN